MTYTTKLFELAQLAEASYADLVGGNTVLLEELQKAANGMTFSLTQAMHILAQPEHPF